MYLLEDKELNVPVGSQAIALTQFPRSYPGKVESASLEVLHGLFLLSKLSGKPVPGNGFEGGEGRHKSLRVFSESDTRLSYIVASNFMLFIPQM